jgi:ribonuclease-3
VDGGYEAVREVIFRLFRDEDRLVAPKVKDDKSALQEYTQAHDMGLPAYRIIESSGPDHDRHFVAEVLICGRQMATGKGSSKKSAEQMAARAALKRCQDEE